MLEFLKDYTGSIEVNGNIIDNSEISNIIDKLKGKISIKLTPTNKIESVRNTFTEQEKAVRDEKEIVYNVFVKPWMTQKSSDSFNFMLTWNNDVPMPFRYMRGNINKETSGMYNMTLHGVANRTATCSVCGRTLTNPISRLFGIGPECMNKVGLFPDISIEEAESKLDEIKQRIENKTWTGWIAKSAIIEMLEVGNR